MRVSAAWVGVCVSVCCVSDCGACVYEWTYGCAGMWARVDVGYERVCCEHTVPACTAAWGTLSRAGEERGSRAGVRLCMCLKKLKSD